MSFGATAHSTLENRPLVMAERIQTRISMPPLCSKGGIAGRRTGFKGSPERGVWTAPKACCGRPPNAVRRLVAKRKSRLSTDCDPLDLMSVWNCCVCCFMLPFPAGVARSFVGGLLNSKPHPWNQSSFNLDAACGEQLTRGTGTCCLRIDETCLQGQERSSFSQVRRNNDVGCPSSMIRKGPDLRSFFLNMKSISMVSFGLSQ